MVGPWSSAGPPSWGRRRGTGVGSRKEQGQAHWYCCPLGLPCPAWRGRGGCGCPFECSRQVDWSLAYWGLGQHVAGAPGGNMHTVGQVFSSLGCRLARGGAAGAELRWFVMVQCGFTHGHGVLSQYELGLDLNSSLPSPSLLILPIEMPRLVFNCEASCCGFPSPPPLSSSSNLSLHLD